MSCPNKGYIEYKKGYKYQLHHDYEFPLPAALRGWVPFETGFITGTEDGIVVKRGYAWDGPSGITIDTPNFMRGSLEHDIFYQLIREHILPAGARKLIDKYLRETLKQDGMSRIRAAWVYWAVRLFGVDSIKPSNIRHTLQAP